MGVGEVADGMWMLDGRVRLWMMGRRQCLSNYCNKIINFDTIFSIKGTKVHMARADKLLKKWRKQVPTDARKEDVFLLLDVFGFERSDNSGGSHFQYYHEALGMLRPDLFPLSEVTVIVYGGQKVKSFYIKNVLKAISVVEEYLSQCDE